jgi:predicted TIM-barrel fold metal-dependent hydrolase
MDIVVALKQEEAELQKQLKGIQGAIAALDGARHTPHGARRVSHKGVHKRTMSAAARANISKATKARWEMFRAENAKKGK